MIWQRVMENVGNEAVWKGVAEGRPLVRLREPEYYDRLITHPTSGRDLYLDDYRSDQEEEDVGAAGAASCSAAGAKSERTEAEAGARAPADAEVINDSILPSDWEVAELRVEADRLKVPGESAAAMSDNLFSALERKDQFQFEEFIKEMDEMD